MSESHDKREPYGGFEQGPIRPPSEADSLLLRVTRNCPWNRCTFCPVYKGSKFSIRSVDHVKLDIDSVHRHVEAIRGLADETGRVPGDRIDRMVGSLGHDATRAFSAALHWMAAGMKSVFLQDANSLVVKPARLVAVLTHLAERFGSIERITSYARSQTVGRMADDDLRTLRDAGLNRIHIGLESGCDRVLEIVKKGVTKEIAVEAGLKVKRAGIELSEYYMPGLGGVTLSSEHALESADAMNRIDPDFIRLRSLAIPTSVPLFEAYEAGDFEKCTDLQVAAETLTFIEALDDITSAVKSDHILNLFEDLEGVLPHDRERMADILRTFIEMVPERRVLYQVGRRIGVFSQLSDLDDPRKRAAAEQCCQQFGITPENVDDQVDTMMRRFV